MALHGSRSALSLRSSINNPRRAPASAEPIWDPFEALEVENPDKEFKVTCVGWAPSKGRRCQNPIASYNRVCAEKILQRLSYDRPSVTGMREDLEQVAECLLCKRYHRDQIEEVVHDWVAILRQERRTLRQVEMRWDAGTPSQSSSSRSDESSSSGRMPTMRRDSMFSDDRSSSSSSGVSRESTLLFPMDMSRSSSFAQAAAIPTPVRPLLPPPDTAASTPTVSTPSPRPSTYNYFPRQEVRPATVRATALPSSLPQLQTSSGSGDHLPDIELPPPGAVGIVLEPQVVASHGPIEADTIGMLSGPSSSTSTPAAASDSSSAPAALSSSLSLPFAQLASPVSPSAPTVQEPTPPPTGPSHSTTVPSQPQTAPQPVPVCTAAHVQRRPIGESCGICHSSMIDTSYPDLVWCKAADGCGISVHRACFTPWEQVSQEAELDLRCMFCRRDWVWCAAHDNARPVVYSIWNEDELWTPHLFDAPY